MGNVTSREALALQWVAVCNDPGLRDLPYKIELNAWGKIEMSPASNRHGRLQGLIGAALHQQLPGGILIVEAAVLTDIGVRVPDVAWGSEEFARTYGEMTPYPRAPEICVEIVSPSNSDAEIQEKTRAYLAAGAIEVWIVAEDGFIRYHSTSGEITASSYAVKLELPGRIART